MWEEASLSVTGRPGLKSCRSFYLSSGPGPSKVGCTVPMFQLAHVQQEGGLGDAAAAAKAASEQATNPTPTAVPVHSVKTRSVSEYSSQPKCKAKLVDNCSWPHCNRSCPKLKNPETGEF